MALFPNRPPALPVDSVMSRWFDAASGWVLSAGIHLALLLGAGLICIEQFLHPSTDPGFRVSTRSTLLFDAEAGLPTGSEGYRYRRLPMPDEGISESMEESGRLLGGTGDDEGPAGGPYGGVGCPYLGPDDLKAMWDAAAYFTRAEIGPDFRSRSSSAPGRFAWDHPGVFGACR